MKGSLFEGRIRYIQTGGVAHMIFPDVCSYDQKCALHFGTKVASQESVWLIKALNVGMSVSVLNFAI